MQEKESSFPIWVIYTDEPRKLVLVETPEKLKNAQGFTVLSTKKNLENDLNYPILKLDKLQTGDTVIARNNKGGVMYHGHNTLTVKSVNKKEEYVEFFRPYTHTADFTCTSGVFCYVGVEQYKIPRDFSGFYYLLDRKELQ